MKKKINVWWIAAGILGLLLIGFSIFYFTYNRMVVKSNKKKNDEKIVLLPTATPTPDPLAPYSILLLAYGGGNHEGGSLTDSIMVAKIDPRAKEVSLISIPRDLWVAIPIEKEKIENRKVNEAYVVGISDKNYPNKSIEFTGEAGGGEMAKSVISQVVGFDIDYFATIDFSAFTRIIDSLGGVNVKVQRSFDDLKYPIEEKITDPCEKSEEEIEALTATMSGEKLEEEFMCRYEALHFDRGIQYMDGETALKFARSRHSTTDGGDFNRAARQRLVVEAIKDKVISINFIPRIIPTIKTLSYHIRTDVTFSEMNELVAKIPEIANYEIIPIPLTDENVLKDAVASTGQFVLLPKLGENSWNDIHEFIENKGVAVTSTTIIKEN